MVIKEWGLGCKCSPRERDRIEGIGIPTNLYGQDLLQVQQIMTRRWGLVGNGIHVVKSMKLIVDSLCYGLDDWEPCEAIGCKLGAVA